jgi:RNA polymerase sigma-70 factor (ECF subfamily)
MLFMFAAPATDANPLPTAPDEAVPAAETGWTAETFGNAVAQVRARLLAYLIHHTKTREEAEDLLSAVLAEGWAHHQQYREQGHSTAWFFTIARRMLSKQQRRRDRCELSWEDEQIAAPVHTEPEQIMLEREAFVARLAVLSPTQQTLVLLRYIYGLPVSQIAAHTGYSEAKIRKELQRAAQRLESNIQ